MKPEQFKIDDVVKFLLTSFRTYDLRHVTKDYMNKMCSGAQGLVNFNRKKVYVRKDLQNGDHDRVLLHELSHIYLDGLVGGDNSEDDVWGLAYAWINTIYGGKK